MLLKRLRAVFPPMSLSECLIRLFRLIFNCPAVRDFGSYKSGLDPWFFNLNGKCSYSVILKDESVDGSFILYEPSS